MKVKWLALHKARDQVPKRKAKWLARHKANDKEADRRARNAELFTKRYADKHNEMREARRWSLLCLSVSWLFVRRARTARYSAARKLCRLLHDACEN